MTFTQVTQAAWRLGGHAENDRETMTFYVYSPKGQVWADNGASVLLEDYGNPTTHRAWKARAITTLKHRMQAGTAPADSDGDYWWT